MKKRQKKDLYLAILVLFLAAFAVWSVYARESKINQSMPSRPAESVNESKNTSQQAEQSKTGDGAGSVAPEKSEQKPLPSLPKAPDRLSTEEDAAVNVDLQVFAVKYTKSGFAPSILEVKRGDIVSFENTSDQSFWPASDPHPSHLKYSEFDARQSLLPGEVFSFQFQKVGEWSYHDHLNPNAKGVVKVVQ